MAHQRKLIRDKMVEILTAAIPEVEGRVFETRLSQIWEKSELPCIAVYTRGEESEAHGTYHSILQRTLDLSVEILLKGNDDLDDQVDALALKVERAIAEDLSLGRTCEYCTLASTEISFDDSGARSLGSARLGFEVVYITEF